MHVVGADLDFDNTVVRGDDCGVERAVAVWFREGDVVFDAAGHRAPDFVDDAEYLIAFFDGVDYHANCKIVIDIVHVPVTALEFLLAGREYILSAPSTTALT